MSENADHKARGAGRKSKKPEQLQICGHPKSRLKFIPGTHLKACMDCEPGKFAPHVEG
jgi:hypothetical protein